MLDNKYNVQRLYFRTTRTRDILLPYLFVNQIVLSTPKDEATDVKVTAQNYPVDQSPKVFILSA